MDWMIGLVSMLMAFAIGTVGAGFLTLSQLVTLLPDRVEMPVRVVLTWLGWL